MEDIRCLKCNAVFIPTKKWGYTTAYCSRRCANSKIITDEHRTKVSKTLTKPLISLSCENCNNVFIVNRRSKKKRFCSINCIVKNREKNKSKFRIYSDMCKFKFNVVDFPDYFEIRLINEFGWYKPKNKGNNLNGISKDHLYSIKKGFENNIDPYFISHPANCKLIRHRDNQIKNTKCSITINELHNEVDIFNKKYGWVPE